MRRTGIISISLLAVLVLLIGAGAGACGGGASLPGEEEEEVTSGPPMPGQWTASTDFGELGFTVDSGSTGITKVSFNFEEFEYGGAQMSGGASAENLSLWPITNGKFTIDASMAFGDVVIEGEFDKTGTHASGTWEINTCSGTWEASH